MVSTFWLAEDGDLLVPYESPGGAPWDEGDYPLPLIPYEIVKGISPARLACPPWADYLCRAIRAHALNEPHPRPPVVKLHTDGKPWHLTLGETTYPIRWWAEIFHPLENSEAISNLIYHRITGIKGYNRRLWDPWEAISKPKQQKRRLSERADPPGDPLLHLAHSAKW